MDALYMLYLLCYGPVLHIAQASLSVILRLSDGKMNPEENNVRLFLHEQLRSLTFFESFAYIWEQWTSRPHVKVEGYGWIFKLLLWCLR